MSTNPKIAEIEIGLDEAKASAGAALNAGGFKMFNRVLDWITSDRTQLINITDRINEIVRKSGVRDGIVHLQSLHTTTAVFLNEWQDALLQDVKQFLEDVVARVSAVMTLLAGDVIATGTPAGVGPLQPGDRVEVRIDGIGSLKNPVIKLQEA